MKKLFTAASAALLIASCTNDLSSLNENSKAPVQVPAGTLIANATVDLSDYMASVNVNLNNFTLWAQHWTQTTYTDESNYNYNQRDVNGNTFDAMYANVLRDLNDAKGIIAADASLTAQVQANQMAIADLLQVYAYHLLVDIHNDVPYSEALGDDVTPKYDNASGIYADLVARILTAHGTLAGDNGMGAYDLLYGGDSDAWKKFAASLALKLAVRSADVDADGSAKLVGETAAGAGVFTSSADNASMTYTSSPPHTNPLWESLVQSGRTDFCASNTVADVMNGLNDPRRGVYFRNLDSVGNLTGGIYGQNSAYNTHSQPGNALEVPSLAAHFMSYSEVCFLLADASARGWTIAGTAGEHYDNGVTASLAQWGIAGAEATAYLAQTTVAYDPTIWMERIGVQKWLSMYMRGNEAYNTVRQYDYPAMNIADVAQRPVPNRMSYGVDEYSLNTTNVGAANNSSDLDTDKVFWDVN
ncbi:MAG: Uncharacterised protein [Owenweeksia sp. TMED14]|nr:MAG: Uncharacterised protein [Owenweeksia sp. TMED14]